MEIKGSMERNMLDEKGKIKVINPKVCNALREDVQRELSDYLQGYGLILELGNATFANQ